ncbi:MAG: GNAT family N-acetyltransferase [Bacillota bacterium]
MEIRQATLADEKAVCRLWSLLLKFYNKQPSLEVLQCSFRYAVDHPRKVLIFIILIEGVVTGTVSLQMGHFSTWNNNWYGHLEDLIIDPAYRGRGAAEKLINHAVKEARENNLARLELSALNDNGKARRLYEKLGFTTNSVVYELPLY